MCVFIEMFPENIQEVASGVLPSTYSSISRASVLSLHYVLFDFRSSMAEDILIEIIFLRTRWK